MNQLKIDAENCVKCETCSNVCPAGIIELGELIHVSEENALIV